jgi:DNA-binding protein HU-beta
MADTVTKKELGVLLAARMETDVKTATEWLDAVTETLYEVIRAGNPVTLSGFGGFYVRKEHPAWVFKFNPSQRLRLLFGWSSIYKGKL